MNVAKTKLEHLTIFTVKACKVKSDGPILIIGNAYAMMPYQKSLAVNLAQKGYDCSWFAFSGQNGTRGIYSHSSAVKDLALTVKYLSSKNKSMPISIIAHCAGSLMALEYLRIHSSNLVNEIIIYGLLYKPSRRQRFAQAMFKKIGTKEALTEDDWNYNSIPAIKGCDVPILFCHPLDKLNLERGTREEIEYAKKNSKNGEIIWFDNGYDNDLSLIPNYIEVYTKWIAMQRRRKLAKCK